VLVELAQVVGGGHQLPFDRAADQPRLANLVNPRLCLVVPKIGSMSWARCL
jgi:hypothetical protein